MYINFYKVCQVVDTLKPFPPNITDKLHGPPNINEQVLMVPETDRRTSNLIYIIIIINMLHVINNKDALKC